MANTPTFLRLTLPEILERVRTFRFTRRITEVHLHHTWRPNHEQYRKNPRGVIEGMWRYHTQQCGWRDIAQHVTVGAEGALWVGRDWNMAPASATGRNGNAVAGPFMIEMAGDFDIGKDPFGGAQKESALGLIACIQQRCQLPPDALRFHCQMSKKTCPGTQIDYAATVEQVRQIHESLRLVRVS